MPDSRVATVRVVGVVARLTLGATAACVFANRESCYRQLLLAGSADLAFHALACRQTILAVLCQALAHTEEQSI